MTQQLPPPPSGFSSKAPASAPPPPQGFSAQPVQPQQPAEQSFMERFRQRGEELSAITDAKAAERTLGTIGATPEAQRGIAAIIQNQSPVLGKIASGILGLGKRTTETEVAPELSTADVTQLGPELAFNLAMNFNTDEIAQVASKELGEDSVRKDELGNTFVSVGDKEFIINRPGFSAQDRRVALNDFVAFLPTSRAVGFATSVLGKLGIAAATSAGTQTAIEGVQAATGAEFSPGEIGLAAAVGPLGEIPGALAATKRLQGSAKSLLPDVTEADALAAREFREQTGVSLLPSQASQTQKDQLVNFLVFQDPATSKQFGERLSGQSKDVFDGAFSMLDELASTDEAARAALDVQNTSKAAIKSAKANRSKQTGPLYEKIWADSKAANKLLDTSDVVTNLDNLAGEALGTATIKEANDIKTMVQRASRDAGGSNVQRLHDLKRALFQKRDSLKAKNNGFLDDEIKDLYDNAWGMVREKLVNEAPGYAEANQLFKDLSPAVEKVEGVMGSISKVPEDKLNQISKGIFNLDEFIANPERFDNTKRLIKGANPDAWNALTRSRFEQDLAEIGIETSADALDPNVNFVQAMWQKSFKGKEKTLFKSAMDGDMKKNYEALAEVFNRTRKLPSQSSTVALTKLQDDLSGKRGVANTIAAIENKNAAGMFAKLFDSPQVREKNLKVIADIITDPKWMDKMSEIRKLGMSTGDGGAAFMQVFRDALNESDEVTTDDRN